MQLLFDFQYLTECLSKRILVDSESRLGDEMHAEVYNLIQSRISKQALTTKINPNLSTSVQKAFIRSSTLYGSILTLNAPIP